MTLLPEGSDATLKASVPDRAATLNRGVYLGDLYLGVYLGDACIMSEVWMGGGVYIYGHTV